MTNQSHSTPMEIAIGSTDPSEPIVVPDGGRQLHALLQELLGTSITIDADTSRVTGTIAAYNASLRYIEDADGPRIDVADGGTQFATIRASQVQTLEDLHWELVKQTPPLPAPEDFRADAADERSVIVCWKSPTSDAFQYAAGTVADVYRTSRSSEYDYAGTRVDIALPDEERDLYIQHGRFAVGSTTYGSGAPTERRIGGLIAVYRAVEPTPTVLPVDHVDADAGQADSREMVADD